MAKKVVTFGELMIRLQPYNYERFVQADHLEFTFGGGEANVAVSLANYGLDAAYVTKLPAHAIGQAAVNSLRRYGVDTSKITRGGDRVGIYFNEKGASQRPSVCIYDRAHSAISEATTADFDWDAIFEGVEWFHFTGITPALGANVVELIKTVLPMDGIAMMTLFTVGSLLPCVGIAILLKQIVKKATDFVPFLFGFVLAASIGINLVSATVVAGMFAIINYKIKMLSVAKAADSGFDDEEEEI